MFWWVLERQINERNCFMGIQELTQPKTENSVFRPASGQCFARVMAVIAIVTIIISCICALNWWPSSRVSAGQNDAGDPNHGREVFAKRCAGCHALDREKEGPRLRGVFG